MTQVYKLTIYTFCGNHRDKGEALLREAVKIFAYENQIVPAIEANSLLLGKTKNGKPYFRGLPINFSISHTGRLWGCLISFSNVGFDIQEKRELDFNRLAARFFHEKEMNYVRNVGLDGFFDIWVRKEACVKYHGAKLISDIRSFSVVRDGKLTEKTEYKGGLCFVNPVELGSAVKCAYCSGSEGAEVRIKELK